tara:strand:+ start:54 stop:812 length:759 start_codon:yes stop_codon:yes gene_type:complete
MKSPIRSSIEFKSGNELKKLIPPDSTISSFFLYSGNLELSLAQTSRTIIAHTNKYVIYEFWQALKENKNKIVAAVENFYPQIDPMLFHYLQETWPQFGDPYTRSAFFFILNRCSAQGDVSTGKLDKRNYNSLAVNYLRNFEGANFFPVLDKEENPLEAISTAKQADFILFPVGNFSFNLFEYGKSRGYEMTSINHKELSERIAQLDKKWAIIYRPHPKLFEMYKDYNIRMIDKYGRKCGKTDNCEELLIANF